MTIQTSLNIREDINQIVAEFESAFAKADATALANFYTDNGMVLPPGSDLVQGTAEIRQLWQELLNQGIKNIKLEVLEVEQLGDTAIEVGKAILYGENDQVVDKGKYMVVWKQQNEQWKIHRDIFNSSLTPPSV
jgi:uncharacterized protein (TIGR02246 family)